VLAAFRRWARKTARARTGVLRLGCFGSYARGRPGVGSDLDVVAVVERSEEPFERRAAGWDVVGLPVPVDLLVYTREEWERLDPKSRFGRMMAKDALWVDLGASARSK